MKTATTSKQALMQSTERDMQSLIQDMELTDHEKLALTCRILFDKGHDSGLAGQITCRTEHRDTFLTQRLGLGFDEITADNLITVDHSHPPDPRGCAGHAGGTTADLPDGRLRSVRRLLVRRGLAWCPRRQ